MKNVCSILLITSLLASCGGNSSNASLAPDLEGYQLEEYPGGTGQRAFAVDANGNVAEEGAVVNGQRNGAWLSYHATNKRIKTITNYLNGMPHGVHLELNDRGQVEVKAYYSAGVAHGARSSYRFGKATEEAFYKNGELDGPYRKYYNNGKPEQESIFVNGKREGAAKFYNDKGELILQYEYKNGEKVGGGKVEAAATTE